MKRILILVLGLVATTAFASTDRYLDGKYITNGAATLTLPTVTDSLVGKDETVTLTNKTIDGSSNTYLNVPTSSLSGVVDMANGGTGFSSPSVNGVIYGDTSALNFTAAGTQYEVLQAGGSGVPTFGPVNLDQSAAVTGSLGIANGGTGQATANDAFNALAPSQTGNSGKFLTTDGTDSSWATIPAATPTVTGSQASPTLITAVGGISFSGSNYFNIIFIAGDSGAVTVSANPQVGAGSIVGQKLTLVATSATDTVTLADGTGLSLNGSWVGSNNSALELVWNGSVWYEVSRR